MVNNVEYFAVPFEICSTYHQNQVICSDLTAGILADYGYDINFESEVIQKGNQSYINTKDYLATNFNISLGEGFKMQLAYMYGE